ncbi:MerR family transcriptional regulator [Acidothermaceae bacterium B102]|nr:MerR family transcriptional regulator [Acidothermaceae bacterium B102]
MIRQVTSLDGPGQDSGSGSEPSPRDVPRYTVAAVARRLGVAPSTLRTWDRRYGLGPSAHEAGAHRRFTEADVERLQLMRRLVVQGVPAAEAARTVAAHTPEMLAESQRLSAPEPVQAVTGQHGGGRVVSLPGGSPDVRGLARAAMSLDGATVVTAIRRSLREQGVADTWHGLIGPVLQGVGERWQATGEGVEVEHLLAESVLVAMRSYGAPDPAGPARVLLAGAPNDYHALPLHVLAAALAERGIATRNLGASVPGEALADAVRRVGPAVLFLWSSLRTTGDPAVLAEVPTTVPAVSLLLGGPGWWLEELPSRVTFSQDVPHAVELVEHRLGL